MLSPSIFSARSWIRFIIHVIGHRADEPEPVLVVANRLIVVALPVVVGWRRELRVVLAQVVQVLRGCLRSDIEETTHAW